MPEYKLVSFNEKLLFRINFEPENCLKTFFLRVFTCANLLRIFYDYSVITFYPKLVLKRFITWTRVFVTWPCFIARPRTRLSSKFRWGIGTSSWSILYSSATSYWTIAPGIPIGPITVNCITQPLNKVSRQLHKRFRIKKKQSHLIL